MGPFNELDVFSIIGGYVKNGHSDSFLFVTDSHDSSPIFLCPALR
jgi:hypothetical protein